MNYAIVLAGGKGTRMNSEIPKQFLVVGGKPLISYSLDVFEKSPFIDAIIIVTSQDYTGYMKALVKENGYKKIAGIALGGKERYDSVHSGLELIQTLMSSGAGQLSRDEEWLSGEDYIFIHDGARPCVTAQIIYNCMQDVMEYKACVAAVPVKDTIKVADKAGMSVNTPDRSTLWQIQTPQSFEYELIMDAYEKMIKVCKDEKKLKGKKSALDVVKNIVGSSNNEQFKSKMQIIDKVMNETALMVMKNKGEIILPLYHEISGGMTRNGLEVLGEEYGYLLAGVCQDDYNNSDYKMERYFTMAELADKMKKAKIIIYDSDKNEIDLKNITASKMAENTNILKDSSEYAVSVKIFETGISGEDFANALNVDSSNITLEYIDDKIKITTKGKGHGFGLSMNQAEKYGEQGMGYEEILKKFYDVTIAE